MFTNISSRVRGCILTIRSNQPLLLNGNMNVAIQEGSYAPIIQITENVASGFDIMLDSATFTANIMGADGSMLCPVWLIDKVFLQYPVNFNEFNAGGENSFYLFKKWLSSTIEEMFLTYLLNDLNPSVEGFMFTGNSFNAVDVSCQVLTNF